MRARTAPWFKCFPEDWLEGTRKLTPAQRGLYFDCLCLIYKSDEPLPDDDRWLSHQLHVSVREWRAVRKVLIDAGKLVQNGVHLSNSRASREVLDRASMRSEKALVAATRERKKREQPENVNENSDGKAQLCLVESTDGAQNEHYARARLDHHQNLDTEKEERSSSDVRIDDDLKPLPRTISSAVTASLANRVGEERATELVAEYLGSDYATNAKIINRAFTGWLKKTYQIDISARGVSTPMAEIVALCGVDARGRPDLSLPKTVSRRRSA